VAVYFLDTSALAKRYVTETGSGWIRSITDPLNYHEIYVAKIVAPEAVSALIRQTPPLANLTTVVADFHFDFNNQYQQLALTDIVIETAMRLVEAYRLRGYDAVQLATAVELNTVRTAAGLPPLVFVSADQSLNFTAASESLAVDDPNSYP